MASALFNSPCHDVILLWAYVIFRNNSNGTAKSFSLLFLHFYSFFFFSSPVFGALCGWWCPSHLPILPLPRTGPVSGTRRNCLAYKSKFFKSNRDSKVLRKSLYSPGKVAFYDRLIAIEFAALIFSMKCLKQHTS